MPFARPTHPTRALLPCALALALAGCARAPESAGEPLTLAKTTPVADIVKDPAAFAGERVRVEGTLVDVCQHAGCFFTVDDGTERIYVDLQEGLRFTVPKSSGGRRAAVEGVVVDSPDARVSLVGKGVRFLGGS